MDGLFSKALDVLEPLQSKVSSALDSTLNEYPKPTDESLPHSHSHSHSLPSPSAPSRMNPSDDYGLSPAALEGARRVLGYWEELELEGKKEGWDQQSLGISQLQDVSMKNRKTLADLTKAFKSGDKKDVSSLLKAYQGEIDSLTKRAKHAEGAYLSMYQLMYDAPDVVPSLRALVNVAERVSAVEQESRRCRQELEMLKREATAAKSMVSTLRRLEERNAELEEAMDAKVAAIVEQKQKEVEVDLQVAQERETALLETLEETRETLAALQRQHDKAQTSLFEMRTKMEEERASKQHELEAASEEIERAQDRVRSLELVHMEMTAELERLRVGVFEEGEAAQQQSFHELENSLQLKEKLISTLHDQIQQLEASFTTEREKQQRVVGELEERLQEQEEKVEAFKMELAVRPTVEQMEELRKQSRVLQELIGSEVDEWDKVEGFSELEDDSETAKVQRALRETNRKLTTELTSAKIALAEKQNEAEGAMQRIAILEEHAAQLQALVARLEEDIMKGSEMQSKRDGWNDGSAAAMTGLLSDSTEEAPPPSGSKAVVPAEGTMLEIVCGQRERFRRRVKELEGENGALQDTLGRSAAEIQRLKNDNVSLYEKIKYLEQYNRQGVMRRVGGSQNSGDVVVFGGGGGGRGARYACFGVGEPGSGLEVVMGQESSHLSSLGGGGGGNAEMRYRKLYEDRINPFNEFHERERERSYRDLRLHDKITLTGGRFLLSNKYGRVFVFVYTIILHLFIFFMLYRLSHPRTVVIQPVGVGGRGVPAVSLNETANVAALANMNSTRTLSDTIAEKVGTLMEATRGMTNQRRRRRR